MLNFQTAQTAQTADLPNWYRAHLVTLNVATPDVGPVVRAREASVGVMMDRRGTNSPAYVVVQAEAMAGRAAGAPAADTTGDEGR